MWCGTRGVHLHEGRGHRGSFAPGSLLGTRVQVRACLGFLDVAARHTRVIVWVALRHARAGASSVGLPGRGGAATAGERALSFVECLIVARLCKCELVESLDVAARYTPKGKRYVLWCACVRQGCASLGRSWRWRVSAPLWWLGLSCGACQRSARERMASVVECLSATRLYKVVHSLSGVCLSPCGYLQRRSTGQLAQAAKHTYVPYMMR